MKKTAWKNAQELSVLVDNYFLNCEENGKPMTRTGLAVFLALTKEELAAYRRGEFDTQTKHFSSILKFADVKIEEYAENLLFTRDKGHTAIMFYLKSNFGWSDKIEDEQEDGDISVKISVI